MTTDPLGSYRDELVHGILVRRGRLRRRLTASIGAAAVLLLVVGAWAVGPDRSEDETLVVQGPPVRTAPEQLVQPEECPVTMASEPGFQAPERWPARPPNDVWYGTADLWTVLPVDGSSPTPRKSVWWSAHFLGGGAEPTPELAVTWRRLDAIADLVEGGGGTNAHTAEHGWFMIGGIDPPSAGCWEVTATYRGHELSYVYWNPPRVLAHSAPSDGSDSALVTGRLVFDESENCYQLEQPDERYPVVWPYGTTASPDGATSRSGMGRRWMSATRCVAPAAMTAKTRS